MFVRPTRLATARSPHDARQTIVHRNELNEQQRPGVLVLFPQSFQETRGAKAATRWIPKLIRQLTDEGDGADASAILADGLLFYTGAYIRQNFLDKNSLIPEALLCKDVLFITNHVDVSPVRGHSSSMAGTPVRAGAIPGIRPRARAQTANTLRLVLPPLITPCFPRSQAIYFTSAPGQILELDSLTTSTPARTSRTRPSCSAAILSLSSKARRAR